MDSTADLRQVSTSALERLREAIASGKLKTPVDRAALVGFGIKNQLDALERALAGHKSAACVSILDAALAERADTRPAPELVWTGPEGVAATARDTAVVLRSLFENAQTNVVLAGYSFIHGKEVLEPLHKAMKERGVKATFIVHIPQTEAALEVPEKHADTELSSFAEDTWPFGAPYPRIYYDKRALTPGPPYCSMHAKCVAVDGRWAFISSANFTQRGQERNIEAGVLIEDAEFAEHLTMQWLGLIESGAVVEWEGLR